MPKNFKTLSEKNEYWRNWYSNNPDQRAKHIERVKKNNEKYFEWYKSLKIGLKCSKCEENDPVCLDWHHVDPKEKLFAIAECIREGYAKSKVLKEIEKCILLCANCHRKLHAGEA